MRAQAAVTVSSQGRLPRRAGRRLVEAGPALPCMVGFVFREALPLEPVRDPETDRLPRLGARAFVPALLSAAVQEGRRTLFSRVR